ncbi:YqgQ family protein [Bacillus timonensis]|nr:YqgQ family protein [Bacillus timonensis]
MNSVYDLRQFLKKYGTIIYIGDRIADLEMIEAEFKELYQAQIIDSKVFQVALMIIRKEIELEMKKLH